jgi:hypothetical protein
MIRESRQPARRGTAAIRSLAECGRDGSVMGRCHLLRRLGDLRETPGCADPSHDGGAFFGKRTMPVLLAVALLRTA